MFEEKEVNNNSQVNNNELNQPMSNTINNEQSIINNQIPNNDLNQNNNSIPTNNNQNINNQINENINNNASINYNNQNINNGIPSRMENNYQTRESNQFNQPIINNEPLPNNEFNQPISNSESLPNNQSNLNNDDMDDSFLEPKKKGFIGVIILILLILIIAGGACYYYFILDNPKTIFLTAINNIIKNSEPKEIEKINTDFLLETKIVSENEEDKLAGEILNKFSLEGNIGIDFDKEVSSNQLKLNYQNELLADISYQLELSEEKAYLKLNNLLDKMLYVDLSESESIETENDIDSETYKKLIPSIYKALSSSLDNATYEKTYLKLNDEYVKKISLIIDKSFIENIYSKLLQDNDFLESYSKINNLTISEVTDMLNEEMSEIEDGEIALSLYLTILKNEFLKFELIGGGDSIIISNEDNQISFEVTESYTLKLRGFINLIKREEKNNLTLNLELVEDKTIIELYLDYTNNQNKSLNLLDTSNAVNIDTLPESDITTLRDNLLANKAFNSLAEDLGLLDSNNQSPAV